MRRPRAITCGSAKTSSRRLIGPQGTPAASSAAIHSCVVRITVAWRSSGISSARCFTRAALVAKRSSRAQLGLPATSQNLRELAVVADRQDHVAVGGREVLVRHDVRVRVAHAARHRAADQVVGGLVGQAGDLHVEQRQVDVLALAGAVAVRERGQHADGGVQAGEDVGQRDADLLRARALLAVGAAGDAHQPAHALDQEVVAGALRVRAGLAEAGDRAVDQARA